MKWTKAEDAALIDAVNVNTSEYAYHGHTKKAVNYDRVSRIVSNVHGTYRSKQACRCRFIKVKEKRNVEN